jgi:hypothetical protein
VRVLSLYGVYTQKNGNTKTTSPVPLFDSLWLSLFCCVTRETLKEKLTAVSFHTVWCPQSITADQVLCVSIKKTSAHSNSMHSYIPMTKGHMYINYQGNRL